MYVTYWPAAVMLSPTKTIVSRSPKAKPPSDGCGAGWAKTGVHIKSNTQIILAIRIFRPFVGR
jgi:hypothetical protein